MTREVFEYFFDPEELEPFYSELRPSSVPQKHTSQPARQKAADSPAPLTGAGASADDGKPRTALTDVPKIQGDSRSETGVDRRIDEQVASVRSTSALAPGKNASLGPEWASQAAGRTRVRHLLSVHALGQYVYCVRSGILAAERGDEPDIDEPTPRLTYLPNFDREQIEEMLKRKFKQLGFALAYGASMVCLMVAGVLSQNKTLFYPAMCVFIACVMWFLSLSATILQLAVRRRAAVRAEAREPDPQVTGIQAVNWWSMLKAGFEPVNYQRPFRHPELPLEGAPWRVLERGSLRIPVIRSGGDKLGDRPGELYRKHQIRLAAYALLLEAMGPVDVPYGLVFACDSPRGLAYPITDESRGQTVRTLEEFAHRLRDSQQHQVDPMPPEDRKRCENCRHGVPEPIAPRDIDLARKSGDRIVVLQNGDGKTFHCVCGDRFGAAPPHRKSIRMGLTASLQ